MRQSQNTFSESRNTLRAQSSSKRIYAGVAVFLILAASMFAPIASGASAVVAPSYSYIPDSGTAGATTGLVWSGVGPVSEFEGTISIHLAQGSLFAHADTNPGVPPSPISERPQQGEIVGGFTFTSEYVFFGCEGGTDIEKGTFIWDEDWEIPALPTQVAELKVVDAGSTAPFGSLYYQILRSVSATGEVTYTAFSRLLPTNGSANSFFCSGSSYRLTSQIFAPAGKALLVNPRAPGLYETCVDMLSISNNTHTSCTSVALDLEAPPSPVAAFNPLSVGSVGSMPVALSREVGLPACTITGTPGNDTLRGTDGNDVICGLGGDDRLIGGLGDDTLLGGPGDDRLNGGDGNDALFGGSGNDTLNGGKGNDALNAGSGIDRAVGGPGDDSILAGSGADKAIGGPGNDSIGGDTGDDTISGSAGSNVIWGGPGMNLCRVGARDQFGVGIDCL